MCLLKLHDILLFTDKYVKPFCEKGYIPRTGRSAPALVSNFELMSVLQELLFSYNIAVDRSDEMKRSLGKSASSVGLRLPEVYQP